MLMVPRHILPFMLKISCEACIIILKRISIITIIIIIIIPILCSSFSACYTPVHPTVNPFEYVGKYLLMARMMMMARMVRMLRKRTMMLIIVVKRTGKMKAL